MLLLGGRRYRFEHVLHLVQQGGTVVEDLLRGDIVVGDFVVLVGVLIVRGSRLLEIVGRNYLVLSILQLLGAEQINILEERGLRVFKTFTLHYIAMLFYV